MVQMNNKGQVAIVMIMFAIVIFILAMAIAPAIKQSTDTARNEANLNCSEEGISTFDKVTCIASDMTLFYFIGGMIAIAGIIVFARIAFG